MEMHTFSLLYQLIKLLIEDMSVLRVKFGKVKEQHEFLFHTHGNSQLDETKT